MNFNSSLILINTKQDCGLNKILFTVQWAGKRSCENVRFGVYFEHNECSLEILFLDSGIVFAPVIS